MPQKENLTWGPIPKKRVEDFLKVVLDHEEYPDKIKAQWNSGDRELHKLMVLETTKAIIVQLITGGQNLKNREMEKQKAYIQDAMYHLEALNILDDKRKLLIGRGATILYFYLHLPSRDKCEIMQWVFETKWPNSKNCAEDTSIEEPPISPQEYTFGQAEINDSERVAIKLQLPSEKLTGELLEDLVSFLRNHAGDVSMTIEITKPGSVVLILKGSREGCQRLESLFNSGQLNEVLGFPVLEVGIVSESQPAQPGGMWVQLSQWFHPDNLGDWLDEVALKATLLERKLNLSFRSDHAVSATLSDHVENSQTNQLHSLLESLSSNHLDRVRLAAFQLGEIGDDSQQVIDALVTRLLSIEDSETSWQIALTLGKLDPKHPKAAFARFKRMQLAGHKFGLLVALRTSDDDLVDILLQVSPTRQQYLPAGLQLVVLDEFGEKIERDESGETFLEAKAQESDPYLDLDFFGVRGEQLTVKLSLGENANLTENFQI